MRSGDRKTLVIVAGMHRSGTSAFTGAIEQLGITLGRNLAAGHAGINDKGYKEDVDLIELHETLLWSISSAWDDMLATPIKNLGTIDREEAKNKIRSILEGYFSTAVCCGLKDPRICLFLPLWLEVCREEQIEVCFVIPFRNPHAVSRSLEKRDAMHPDRALVLWTKYLLAAEQYSRGYPRLFLSYERLISTPRAVLQAFIDRFDLRLASDHSTLADAGASFIAPELNSTNSDVDRPTAIGFAVDFYGLLQDADGGDLDSVATSKVDAIDQAYRDYLNELNPVLVDQVDAFRRHAVTYRQYWIDAIHSRSVRLASLLKKALRR